MWVNFLFLQSAMPSAHLQGVGQVQDADGKHSKLSSSPKTKNKNNKVCNLTELRHENRLKVKIHIENMASYLHLRVQDRK